MAFSALGLSEAASGKLNSLAIVEVKASSAENEDLAAGKAIDGDLGSRWASEYGEGAQWLMIDLSSSREINTVVIAWELAAALAYKVQTSSDGSNWNDAVEIYDGEAGIEVVALSGVTARYIRVYCLERTSEYGYSILEIAAYGN